MRLHHTAHLATVLLMLVAVMMAAQKAQATINIKDVIFIGGSKKETNTLKNTLTANGWTVINQNLNAGAGGDYIYLLYKAENNFDGYNHGYITDFYISNNKGTAPDELTHEGRTYHLVPYDGGAASIVWISGDPDDDHTVLFANNTKQNIPVIDQTDCDDFGPFTITGMLSTPDHLLLVLNDDAACIVCSRGAVEAVGSN